MLDEKMNMKEYMEFSVTFPLSQGYSHPSFPFCSFSYQWSGLEADDSSSDD